MHQTDVKRYLLPIFVVPRDVLAARKAVLAQSASSFCNYGRFLFFLTGEGYQPSALNLLSEGELVR